MRSVRDFAQVANLKSASDELVHKALEFLGINEEGLSTVDIMILRKIVENFNGGPVGLETLAALLGEDKETLEEVYEPFLMRQGYLEKTARGRQIPHKMLPFLKQKFFGQKTLLNF